MCWRPILLMSMQRLGGKPGHTIGFEHTFIHEMLELSNAIEEGRQPEPNFNDGVKCQAVLEAVERSIDERRWVDLSEM